MGKPDEACGGRKLIQGDEREHARALRVCMVREQAGVDELVPGIGFHPDRDAFVVVGGAMKTLLAKRQNFRVLLVYETSMSLRESLYEITGDQLVAIWPRSHRDRAVEGTRLQRASELPTVHVLQFACADRLCYMQQVAEDVAA